MTHNIIKVINSYVKANWWKRQDAKLRVYRSTGSLVYDSRVAGRYYRREQPEWLLFSYTGIREFIYFFKKKGKGDLL